MLRLLTIGGSGKSKAPGAEGHELPSALRGMNTYTEPRLPE